MVLHGAIIGPIIRQFARKGFTQIYRAINMQDRLINQAWSKARFNKSIRRGVRHGAAAGSILGTAFTDFGDDVEDVFQRPRNVKVLAPGKYGKTRNRYPRRPRYCYPSKQRFSPRRF